MSMKTVEVDFGDRRVGIEVPASASVCEYQEPPERIADPQAAVAAALAKPMGLAPLAEQAKPGMRVVIGFDDITRPAAPAQLILPAIVDELSKAGVRDEDMLFVAATSNHRKNTRSELAAHLGPALFNRFWPLGRIECHDCYDPAKLKRVGVTPGGRVVEHHRAFLEADLQIYQGNVSSQAWKGFTGTGAVIGLASTRSIQSHHSINVVPDPARKKAAGAARPPGVKPEMTAALESATGKQVFYVNAVTGAGGRLAGVYAGHASEVTPPAWALAERMFTVPAPQADILVVGLAQSYSYGHSNNTLIGAVGALVPPRFSPGLPVLREGGVVIALTPSTGTIDPERYPSYQAVIDLYGRYHGVRALVDHEPEFDAHPEWRHRYTHGHGYPPLHPFWLMYELEYTLARAGAVYVAGTRNPGAYRALGLVPTPDFDAAWKLAKKHVGPNPVTVVAPSFFSRPRIKFGVAS